MRTGRTIPVGNCPNESATQKYTTSSNSKAVARLLRGVNLPSQKCKAVLKNGVSNPGISMMEPMMDDDNKVESDPDPVIAAIFRSDPATWEQQIINLLSAYSTCKSRMLVSVALAKTLKVFNNSHYSVSAIERWVSVWEQQTSGFPEFYWSIQFLNVLLGIKKGENPRRARVSRLLDHERRLFDQLFEN